MIRHFLLGLSVPIVLGSLVLIQPGFAQRPGGAGGPPRAISVDVLTAELGSLSPALRYTGTTQPLREVTLRTRTEGLLLELSVDIGDPVAEGSVIGQLDPILLEAALIQAQAELATQEAEVAQTQAQLSNSRTQVEQARLNWIQQKADAERFEQLADEGAIPLQQAEQALTSAQTAQQALRSAEEEVQTQEQAVTAAQQQVDVQESIVAQAAERLSYTELIAPFSGVIIEKWVESGSFLPSSADVVTVADFNRVKVEFPLSELNLAQVSVGQSIQVELDAFPDRLFTGQITRISPAADPEARVIPVEVQIPNPDSRIGSGLLARVQLVTAQAQPIVVPQSALQEQSGSPTVFVIRQQGESVQVSARPVQVGSREDGQVEILSGLEVGERYVVRSSAPLQDGQNVQLSILSDTQGS